MAISVTTTEQKVTASVTNDNVTATVPAASEVSASVSGGFGAVGPTGPQGPQGATGATGQQGASGVISVSAPLLNAGTSTAASISISLGDGLNVVANELAADYTGQSFTDAVVAAAPPTTDASLLTTGTLSASRLAASGVAAGTYSSVTVDTYGRVTAGGTHSVAWDDVTSKPTLFDGSYTSLTNVPSTFTPSAHNQAWSTITSTPTTLSGYGITDAVASSDSRLTDARTPTAHKTSHATGGTDALSAADIGAAAASHTHAASDIASGTLDAARLPLGTASTAGALIVGSGLSVSSGTVSVTTYAVRSDTVTSTAYTGRAVSGSATSSAVWKIKKTVYTSAGAVSSSTTATNVKWDDRLTASYS